MTGEVSLRGAVTAIGGLPEKLLAAHRAGIKRVFIPSENRDDLRDVPEEVRSAVEIVTVSEVSDLLQTAGLLKKKALKPENGTVSADKKSVSETVSL